MQKINQIFGKEVINQTSGEKIATVQDVVLDSDTRHIVALVIRSGGLMGSSSVMRWGSVVSVGDVVVVQTTSELPSVKDDPEVSDLVKQSYRITGTAVISDKGEQLGTVGDIYINERGEIIGYEVKHGMLKGSKYLPADQVQAAGKDAVISRLGELPRMKDIDVDQNEGAASGVADAGAVAAPHVSTLGPENDADTASTYTGATTAMHSSDEPIMSSTQADAYSYSSSEPAALYGDADDTAATAYSADTQNEPARIYADDTADEPVAFAPDADSTYRTDDEPDAVAYSADAADEPVMADPDVVAYSADEPDAATPAYATDTADEPDAATPAYSADAADEPVAFGTDEPDAATPAYSADAADEPVAFGTDEPVLADPDADQDAVQAYGTDAPQEPVASSDTGSDPYANKSNQM